MLSSSNILSIESSFDDSAVSIYNTNGNILFDWKKSQKDNLKFGGIIPEIAARHHAKMLPVGLDLALKEINDKTNLDYISYTKGPGLLGSLNVGALLAHIYSSKFKLPILPIDHLEAHIFSPFISMQFNNIKFPFLALLVSGGHTSLIKITGLGRGNYTLLANTKDDAVGEILDKSARTIGLEYPGAHLLEKIALGASYDNYIPFSRVSSNNALEFSFSGIKTEFNRKFQNSNDKSIDFKSRLSFGLQLAVVDRLVKAIEVAINNTRINNIVFVGGVSANKFITNSINVFIKKLDGKLFVPDIKYTGDNAVMIAYLASLYIQNKNQNYLSYMNKIETYKNTKIPVFCS